MRDRTPFQTKQAELLAEILQWGDPGFVKIQILVTKIANLQLIVMQKRLGRHTFITLILYI